MLHSDTSSNKSLSIVGSPPGPGLPDVSAFEFAFSNPFSASAPLAQHAPTAEARKHVISPVPLQKPLFVDSITGAQLSWSRVRDDALRIAGGLTALGLAPAPVPSPPSGPSSASDPALHLRSAVPPPVLSPVVLLHLPNCLAFPTILYGTLASGLTTSMANPALTPGELAWILGRAKPEVVVTTPEGLTTVLKALDVVEDPKVKETLTKGKGKRLYVVDPGAGEYGLSPAGYHLSYPAGALDWKHLLASPFPSSSSTPEKRTLPFHFAPGDAARRTAVVLWSSGTSGKSKGVLLSHRALCASLTALWVINNAYTAEERFLGFVPFYHVLGLVNVQLLAPAAGATVVVMPRFEPVRMLQLVQAYRITFLHMAPPVAVILAKSPLLDGYDLSSVQGGMSGGAPLSPEIISLVYHRLKFLIKIGYGMSEACSVTNQRGETWDDLGPQLGSAGLAMYGVEIKVVEVGGEGTDQRVVTRGKDGEILVRGPSVMSCYLDSPEATAEALDADGWFHTGDVGKVDSHDRLWITDRLKDVIKVNGYQVSPSDLEGAICACASVADAGVASVYSQSQASELPRAWIVPRDPELRDQCRPAGELTEGLKALGEEVKRWVESKVINYKWLRGNLMFVKEVPKSPAGKILRRNLKDAKGVECVVYSERDSRHQATVRAKL